MSCSHCGMSCACGANEIIAELKVENAKLREALKQEEQFCRASGDVDRANDLAALLEGEADG